MAFPRSLPRADAVAPFIDDPLAAFRRGRERWGDVFLLAEGRPLFSGAEDCAGCVAAFGEANLRRVFTDLDHFGMPVSLADRHSLPPTLAKLNTGLFSMTGDEHRRHQRLLADQLNARSMDACHESIVDGCKAFLEPWQDGAVVPALEEMRRLSLHVASRVMYGATDEALELGQLVQRYFATRRDYTTGAQPEPGRRRRLIALGERLDRELRRSVRRLRRSDERSVVAGLCRARTTAGEALDEQALVTHANVLFMSGSEPTAVAMSWILLLLSQLPALRHSLREQVSAVCGTDALPSAVELGRLTGVERVIKETLRLLPPNAIMIRLTRQPCQLAGFELPERCEVLLSPFLAHREPERFSQPDLFRPARWEGLAPGPFEYLPFGNGQRYCMGRTLAARTLGVSLSSILSRFDWVLAGDQSVDWTVNVNLMPAGEVRLRLGASPLAGGGRLGGPVADLLRLPAPAAV